MANAQIKTIENELNSAPWMTVYVATDCKAEETDFLISQYEEHTEHGRHTETERSTVTTLVLAAQAAVFTYLVAKDFSCAYRWVALLIPAFAAYGLWICYVLNDRFRYHENFAFAFRHVLEKRLGKSYVSQIRQIVKDASKKTGSLHTAWLLIHSGVLLLGLAASISIFAKCGKEPHGEKSEACTPPICGNTTLRIENNPSIVVSTASVPPTKEPHKAHAKPVTRRKCHVTSSGDGGGTDAACQK